jgi:hypothetical protein
LFCERNGTTTVRTKGQKPKPFGSWIAGLNRSRITRKLANTTRIHERESGLRWQGTWKRKRLPAVMNHEGKHGKANSTSCQSIARKNQRRRLDEMNCQPMTNCPTFSQIRPAVESSEAPKIQAIFNILSVSIEITLRWSAQAPTHLHSNSYPYNSGPHHVGTVLARH